MRERVWFTSDNHFDHARVIVLARRPFSDVREMDEAMIRAWNARIEPDDVVYHIGDFGQGDRMRSIFARLNGVKHLAGVGNHDDESTLELDWASISQEREVVVDHQRIYLKHYPLRTWPQAKKSIHLFGHMHGRLRGYSKSLDVGVDVWKFQPVSLQEIQRRLKTLPPDPDFVREPDVDDEPDAVMGMGHGR